MSTRQQLVIPQGVLSLPAASRIVGLYAQNTTLYAVQTNLGWQWPHTQVTLNTTKRTTTPGSFWATPGGNNISYTVLGAGRFGGPARFAITHGASGGLLPNSPVTIFAAPQPPPCTHTLLGGASPLCFAFIAGAWPASQGQIGGVANTLANTTPLSTPNPGRLAVKVGATPPGTILSPTNLASPVWTLNGNPGFTNQASSYAFPYTVGRITMSAPGAAEVFVLSGADNRDGCGAGTIQLVAGSLSQRAYSGPNANRGWIELKLKAVPDETPTMSRAGIAATAGLMLLAVGYVLRRRFRA